MAFSRRPAIAAGSGIALILAGLAAPGALRSDAIVDVLVTRPVAACEAHGEHLQDGRSAWTRSAGPLGDDLRLVLVAFGAALVAAGAMRRATPVRTAAPVAAIVLAIAALAEQLRLLDTARAAGLFTESPSAHATRFFDRTVPAAEIINRTIPPGARFLVIDYSSPLDVNKLDYLVFPRRMFTLPGQIPNLDADRFRELLRSRPDALRECIDAGYRFAVDLDRLVTRLDPGAIIPIEAP